MLARFILIMATTLFLIGGVAMADTDGNAIAHVWVDVDPNITCGAITPNVDLGSIQTGEIPGAIIFRIDANVERCAISIGATMLYKGDDPFTPTVLPIPVLVDAGALVMPTDANPVEGGDPVPWWKFTAERKRHMTRDHKE